MVALLVQGAPTQGPPLGIAARGAPGAADASMLAPRNATAATGDTAAGDTAAGSDIAAAVDAFVAKITAATKGIKGTANNVAVNGQENGKGNVGTNNGLKNGKGNNNGNDQKGDNNGNNNDNGK
ncbi:MAG: hypothetical protein M1836_001767 [Candelina mexicana]|nr:MAG: hypothetical protein M1836_001767 [Candelina mexicana]